MKVKIDNSRAAELMRGELCQIDGCGIGPKGQAVIAGRDALTGEECKVASRATFEVTDVLGDEMTLKQVIL